MSKHDEQFMRRALELAGRGEGHVEPNPMVGCVIVSEGEIVGEGWHRKFGGPHAEIEAIRAAGPRAQDATLYVTIEPCCHQGKTPPCTQAILDAGVHRVVTALGDPNPDISGGGIEKIREAGIEVYVGLAEDVARDLCAPYLKLVTTGSPWIIAKWAMTLDGKMATRSGNSKWISGEASRSIVHVLRGRVDAVVVGRGTAEADDPLLTARPVGPRTATRIVVDSAARLSLESQLVRTARDAPVLVACADDAPQSAEQQLTSAGVEVLRCAGATRGERMEALLGELGRRRMTNVLVEGGSELLGSLFDAQLIDEVHMFIAPKILGGPDAPSPIVGTGVEQMADACRLASLKIEQVGDDVYLSGRVARL